LRKKRYFHEFHEPVRILVVDGYGMVREALVMLLSSCLKNAVIFEASNRGEAIAAATAQKPDIVLIDPDFCGDRDCRCLSEMIAASPNSRLIALTGIRDSVFHEEIFSHGCRGLVLKSQPSEMLLKAIVKVYMGEAWINRIMTVRLLEKLSSPGQMKTSGFSMLTPRELEIVRMISRGMSNGKIAESLFISEKTVRNHVGKIFAKLGLSDRIQLALLAVEQGLNREAPSQPAP